MNVNKFILVVVFSLILLSCETLKEFNFIDFNVEGSEKNEAIQNKEPSPSLSRIKYPQKSDPGKVKSWAFQKLLVKAIESNDLAGVKKYLDLGANPNWGESEAKPESAMYIAAIKGCKECVQLMSTKADFNFSWKHSWCLPIVGAARHSKEMLVYIIENFNVNVNATAMGRYDQENALSALVTKSKAGCIEYLLNKGVNPNFGNPTPWHLYVFNKNIKNGKVDEVKAFINAGANLNVSSARCNALGNAIDKKRKDIVKLLIDSGANPNHCDSEVETSRPALSYAIERNDYESAKLLIDNGANVNGVRFNNCRLEGSLLDYASGRREIDSRIIDLLISKGAR